MFTDIKQLGSGSFGQVKLVQRIGTETLYALKTVTVSYTHLTLPTILLV